MAWPNPFHRHTANTRSVWGYTFDLTPEHLTAEEAHPLKYTYDTLGEDCLNVLNELFPVVRDNGGHSEKPLEKEDSNLAEVKDLQKDPDATVPDGKAKPKRDLYKLLEENHEKHPKLQQLWDEVNTIPDWVDWEQISRGQDVFYRYGGPQLTGLAYQSLLGGMAAQRVIETLSRTGGFGVRVAKHRLFETTQHILECTRSLEAVKPRGAGFASSIRVRLLHAAVRQRILRLTETRPSYYSVEKFGIPINDLDSIGTIATFSSTIIYLSLPRQGIYLRQQEKEDYVALWRLIAHYVGTPTSYFETTHKAKCVMQSLFLNEINPSQVSQTLANNVIRCLENQPPAYASRSMLEASARWLNGNELCDALALGPPSLYHTCLMAGQCLFFMTFCYTYRSIPYLDRRKIERLKVIFWQLIVEGKYGLQGDPTVFDFKYIPEYDTVTYKGGDEEVKHYEYSVETRNLKSFTLGVIAISLMGYLGAKSSIPVVGALWRGGTLLFRAVKDAI